MNKDPEWKRQDAIAVLGGSSRYTEAQIISGFRIGCEIGRLRRILVTGATTGIPFAAALGARNRKGIVIGVSPAGSVQDHVSHYRKPLQQADVMIFTGLGLEGRSPLILRSVDGAIFVGGEFGTLGEFCSAWICGNKVLGILEGVGGVSESITQLVDRMGSDYGNELICDSNPEILVRNVCAKIEHQRATYNSLQDVTEPNADVRKWLASYLNNGFSKE